VAVETRMAAFTRLHRTAGPGSEVHRRGSHARRSGGRPESPGGQLRGHRAPASRAGTQGPGSVGVRRRGPDPQPTTDDAGGGVRGSRRRTVASGVQTRRCRGARPGLGDLPACRRHRAVGRGAGRDAASGPATRHVARGPAAAGHRLAGPDPVGVEGRPVDRVRIHEQGRQRGVGSLGEHDRDSPASGVRQARRSLPGPAHQCHVQAGHGTSRRCSLPAVFRR
jgi:hypothetical protein